TRTVKALRAHAAVNMDGDHLKVVERSVLLNLRTLSGQRDTFVSLSLRRDPDVPDDLGAGRKLVHVTDNNRRCYSRQWRPQYSAQSSKPPMDEGPKMSSPILRGSSFHRGT